MKIISTPDNKLDTVRLIPIEQIKAARPALPISYPLESPALLDSIAAVGLISPLLVQEADGAYQVICGHRRLFACRALKERAVKCLILPQPLGELESLLVNLHDNVHGRTLNPVEHSLAVNSLSLFLPEEEVVEKYLPLLGLNPHLRVKEKLAPLSSLEEEVKQALARGTLHPEAAARLSEFAPRERSLLFAVLRQVHLSTSKQLEVMDSLEILAMRHDTPMQSVLAGHGLCDILEQTDLSPARKGERLRLALQELRLPLYSKARHDFSGLKKQLKLPPAVNLTPPPYFESDTYNVSFSFRNPAELERHLDKLREAAKKAALRKMFLLGNTE